LSFCAITGKTPKKTLKGGLVIEDMKVGNGPDAKPGKMVGVYYVGKLKQNNKQFDACKEGAKPFKFRVGKGEVIKAWDLGLEGMKVNIASVMVFKGLRTILQPLFIYLKLTWQ
jgi:FKBP-type peptidyl-prolyl cis-trans isomerase